MFGQTLASNLRHSTNEIDLVARITQHPNRPRPLRAYDQIYMLPGSQLSQAKVISDYVYGRSVAFVGDGDCMSLVLAYLGKLKLIEPMKHVFVFDFDRRILKFIKETARELQIDKDLIETIPYNVCNPIPDKYAERADAFYTNPPYGSADQGECGKLFLGRCMEVCSRVRSCGVAILPYEHETEWSRAAMASIQAFLIKQGYVISEMIRGMHQYHLDDRPNLLSGTLVVDRVDHVDAPYKGETIPTESIPNFYGSSGTRMPSFIDENGNPVFDTASAKKAVKDRTK